MVNSNSCFSIFILSDSQQLLTFDHSFLELICTLALGTLYSPGSPSSQSLLLVSFVNPFFSLKLLRRIPELSLWAFFICTLFFGGLRAINIIYMLTMPKFISPSQMPLLSSKLRYSTACSMSNKYLKTSMSKTECLVALNLVSHSLPHLSLKQTIRLGQAKA